jgi:glycosyltransferase involved in cell wall biosynthesis
VKRPLVVTVHELDLGRGESWLMRMYKPWFNSHLFGGGIDRFIVHTSEYRDELVRLGISGDVIRVIPEGVPSVEVSSHGREDAKAELGLTGRRVLTIFGFVVRRKGYEVALDALRRLPEDTALLIAGGCHPGDRSGFVEDVRASVSAQGMSDRVRITDYLTDEQIPLVMAATDVVLAPFTSMSNSGSLLRSIAYGKPIVASDLPATREINARGECLVLARPGDPADLASKVRCLLDDESMLTATVSAAESYAREFGVSRSAEETMSVYKELLP